MQIKKDKRLWTVAVENIELISNIYLKIRKLKIVDSYIFDIKKISAKTFKQAFRSQKTAPEIRALLLNKTFNEYFDINKTLARMPGGSKFKSKPISLGLVGSKDDPYITTVPFNNFKWNSFSKYISELQIPRSEYNELFEAMISGSPNMMKYTLWLNEYKKSWFSIVNILRLTIKLNDILKKYYDYEEEKDTEKTYSKSPTLPIDRFIRDLTQVHRQMYSFRRIEDKLGLNTLNIHTKIEDLLQKANTHKNTHTLSIDEQIQNQYDLFTDMVNVIELVDELFNDEIPKLSSEYIMKKLPKTFFIPTFKPYSVHSASTITHKSTPGEFEKSMAQIASFFKYKK